MFQPPTNGQKILIYGLDSNLVFTRKMVLSTRGYDVDTVCSLKQLRKFASEARPGYDLIILCHTIPVDQRIQVSTLLQSSLSGIYQLEKMESPPEMIDTATEMLSDARASGGPHAQRKQREESHDMTRWKAAA